MKGKVKHTPKKNLISNFFSTMNLQHRSKEHVETGITQELDNLELSSLGEGVTTGLTQEVEDLSLSSQGAPETHDQSSLEVPKTDLTQDLGVLDLEDSLEVHAPLLTLACMDTGARGKRGA